MANFARKIPGKDVGRRPAAHAARRHGLSGESKRFFLIFGMAAIVVALLAFWHYGSQPRPNVADSRNKARADQVGTRAEAAQAGASKENDAIAAAEKLPPLPPNGLRAVPVQTGGIEISFNLAKPGKVSMAVYNAKGRLLRALLSARPLTDGTHSIVWDGLDRDGSPQPAGKYTVKLLQTDGLRSELVANVGVNPVPFWEEGVGNHSGVHAVAVDPDGFTLVPAVAEGGLHIVRIRPDRSYIWAGHDFHSYLFDHFALTSSPRTLHKLDWGYFPCGAAVDGEQILILRECGSLYCIDRGTGQPKDPPSKLGWDDKRDAMVNMSMDAHAGVVVVSYRKHNALRWYDAKTGERKQEKLNLPSPLGVALGSSGEAFVISEGAVLRIQGNAASTFIPASALTAPWRLSFDRQANELLVAENSTAVGIKESHHQVKRFDRNGRLLQTYGAAAGRQDGRYVATDFLNIAAIAADGQGGFAVVEPDAPPRRTAWFDRQGKVRMEFFGAVPYGSRCEPEDDPRYVWYVPGAGLVRAEVDYTARTWRVVETYHGFLRNPLADVGKAHGVGALTYFRRKGRHYLSHTNGTLFIYDPEKKTLRPCNARGLASTDIERNRNPESHGWHLPPDLRPSEKPPFHIRTGYIWSDRNDDGMPSVDELSLFNEWQAGGPPAGGRTAFIDDDMAIVFAGYTSGQRLPASFITPGGTPVYKAEDVEKLETGEGVDLFRSHDGYWYKTISQWGGSGERHGIYWYPSLSGTDRLVKYNAGFDEVWSVGRHSATWDREEGWSHRLEGIAGMVHGCIVVDGNFVDTEHIGPMVWTEDGLFVDYLLIHPEGNFPEWVYTGSRNENPKGKVVKDPRTDDVLFFAFGNSGLPVWRIHGWDGWRQINVEFDLPRPAPAAEAAGTGLRAEYFSNPHWEGKPLIVRTYEKIKFNWIEMAKNEVDWSKNMAVDGKEMPKRHFSVRWTGSIEAPLSEVVMLVVRTGSNHKQQDSNPIVRLWIGEQKIIDSTARLGLEPRNYLREYWRAPVNMRAGERYAIRLEYADRGGPGPVPEEANHVNLCWESPTLERWTIPTKYLYPTTTGKETKPGGLTGDIRLAGRLLPVHSDRPQTMADDGLIAHFKFDEPGGLIARSEIGAGLHATLHGETVRIPNDGGSAIRFAGGMAAIGPELRMPHTDYTIAFRFRAESADGRLFSINRKPTFHNNYHENRISLKDGRIHVWLAGEEKTTDQTYNDGVWRQLVMTVRQGKGFHVYVDAVRVLEGKNDRLGLWHLWHVPTERLGARLGPGNGKSVIDMDEVRVYARPLDKVTDF